MAMSIVSQIWGKEIKLKKKKTNKKKEIELRAESSQRAWLGADFVSTLPAASLLNFPLDSVRAELFPKSPLTWAKQEGSIYFSVKRMLPRSTTLVSSSFHLKSGVHHHLAYHRNKNLTASPGNPSHIGQLHFFEGLFWFCIKKCSFLIPVMPFWATQNKSNHVCLHCSSLPPRSK